MTQWKVNEGDLAQGIPPFIEPGPLPRGGKEYPPGYLVLMQAQVPIEVKRAFMAMLSTHGLKFTRWLQEQIERWMWAHEPATPPPVAITEEEDHVVQGVFLGESLSPEPSSRPDRSL